MTEHVLKCWPEFFDAIKRGDKTFELRRNDRGFQRGDVLVLRKWSPPQPPPPEYAPAYLSWMGHYWDDEPLRLVVTYVLSSEHLREGFVAMGFKMEEPEEPDHPDHYANPSEVAYDRAELRREKEESEP